MSARIDLGNLIQKRFVPLIADLEEVVHRNGYLRVLSVTILSLGFVGVLGQVLEVPWLRTTYATIAGLLFVLASAVAFASTKRLRERIIRSESILHDYADAMRSNTPLVIDEWYEEIDVEANGDVFVRRRYVLEALTDAKTLHHVTMNLAYYSDTPLTDRARRLVKVRVRHGTEPNGEGGVRADATSRWGRSANGFPRLEVYIHLGRLVRAGHTVVSEWRWPGYSVDLMSGKSPETFDVLFVKTIRHFEYTVTFHGAATTGRLRLMEVDAPNMKRETKGQDIEVSFSGDNPALNARMGFKADYASGE